MSAEHQPSPGTTPSHSTSHSTDTSTLPTDAASSGARPSLRLRAAGAVGTLARSRKVLAALGGVAVLAVAGTTWGYASMSRTVTLSVDGEEREVSAMGETVGDVLDDEGIDVGRHDVVAPSLDEEVQDGQAISVRLGRPVELTVDGKTSTHWVTATDVSSALEQIGSRFSGARLSTSRSTDISTRGTSLEVVTPKKVTVSLAGAKPAKEKVPALTVRDALAQLGADVDKHDETDPGLGATLEDGDEITWTDVEVDRRTVQDESYTVPTVTREDSSMTEGTEEVVREGSAGTRDAVYEVTTRNGELADRELLRSTVTDKAVAEVVVVGTAPAVESGDTVWDSLAQCESGGNWAINTGNGYYGGLQFNLQTWQAYGGTGLPSENSRETQIAIAEKLRAATGGYGSWPGCAASLGLPT